MSGTKRSIIAFTCCLFCGCTELADETTAPPPLATITGTLTLTDGARVPDEQLRVALLWQSDRKSTAEERAEEERTCTHTNPYARVPRHQFALDKEQQVDLEGTFPNRFQLNLTSPPMGDALSASEDGGVRDIGFAWLIAYADGNANGKLDPSGPGRPSPDLLLGATEAAGWKTHSDMDRYQTAVVYTPEPREIASEEDGGPVTRYRAGFSQVRSSLVDTKVVPIETPIDLELTGAPYLQDLLCETACLEVPAANACPHDPRDLPQPPANAVAYKSGIAGDSTWSWADETRHTTQSAACVHDTRRLDPEDDVHDYYYYMWTQSVCDTCNCKADLCLYPRDDPDRDIELPCTEYRPVYVP
jgi:hypothetical protein